MFHVFANHSVEFFGLIHLLTIFPTLGSNCVSACCLFPTLGTFWDGFSKGWKKKFQPLEK